MCSVSVRELCKSTIRGGSGLPRGGSGLPSGLHRVCPDDAKTGLAQGLIRVCPGAARVCPEDVRCQLLRTTHQDRYAEDYVVTVFGLHLGGRRPSHLAYVTQLALGHLVKLMLVFAAKFDEVDEEAIGIRFGESASQQVAEALAVLLGVRAWLPICRSTVLRFWRLSLTVWLL